MKQYMNHLLKSVVFFLLVWVIFILGSGELYLVDEVVPIQHSDIDSWMSSYYFAGSVSALSGIIMSLVWYWRGSAYQGESGIETIYWMCFFGSIILGFASGVFLIESAQEMEILALVTAWLVAPVGYYINSLWNCAGAVKYIPPLSMRIHG